MDWTKYTDLDIEIINKDTNESTVKSCHRVIVGNASKLLDDLITTLDDGQPLKVYATDECEYNSCLEILSFLYSNNKISVSSIDFILKYQLHTCALWILMNELLIVGQVNTGGKISIEQIEDLFILVSGKSIWEMDIHTSENTLAIVILSSLFNRWVDFNDTEPFPKFVQKIKKNDLIQFLKSFKMCNYCHDIISLLIIEWCKLNDTLDNTDLTNEVVIKNLSTPLRKNWLNSLHLMGNIVLQHENEKIMEMLSANNKPEYNFKYDRVELSTVIIFETSMLNKLHFKLQMENTFQDVGITYNDMCFAAKLNSLQRYHKENVKMSIHFDCNISVSTAQNTNWVHMSGTFKTGVNYCDEIKMYFDMERILGLNDTMIRISTNAFLKLED